MALAARTGKCTGSSLSFLALWHPSQPALAGHQGPSGRSAKSFGDDWMPEPDAGLYEIVESISAEKS
jgi:hypothetical protein